VSVVNPTLNLPVTHISDDIYYIIFTNKYKRLKTLKFKIWKVNQMKDNFGNECYGCIYKITNLMNHKCYIGQTTNFKRRRKDHIESLNKNNHHNILLQRSWNKYGMHNFKFEIIGYCYDKENIYIQETECKYFFNTFNRLYGYNIAIDEKGGNTYTYLPEDCKKKRNKKISIANKGRKHTIETKIKVSESLKGRRGQQKLKNKTYEEIYGIEEAQKQKEKRGISNEGKHTIRKGKTYEEIYGIERIFEEINKRSKEKKWINNGLIQTYSSYEELETYLQNGWKLGMLYTRWNKKIVKG